MWPRVFKIRHKIALPFTLLIMAAIAATALISVAITVQSAERRFESQILRTSELIARGDLAENPIVLGMLKQMVDAEILAFDRQGELVASTPADPSLLAAVRSLLEADGAFSTDEGPVTRRLEHQGVRLQITWRKAEGRTIGWIAFVVRSGEVAAATRRVTLVIAALSLLLVMVMAVLSRSIAAGITRPVERLVMHTRRLAGGDLGRRIGIEADDEIGSLATAINEMAEQLNELEIRALHSEKLALAGQLAARVAHDIRTPMTSIKLEAQLLRDQPGADKAALETILRQVDRVERVVRGLLDLSRPAPLSQEPGDVNAVVEQALETLGAALSHHKIEVERDLQRPLPPVSLNAAGLEQALLNVIQNSLEALPQGGQLRVATSGSPESGDVLIEIRDDGGGIDLSDLRRAFDPFFTTKRDGVGLGLVNTKSIVERHGGTVALTPAAGGGTLARIRLPAAPRSAAAPPPDRPDGASRVETGTTADG